jgi:hypothetical protein
MALRRRTLAALVALVAITSAVLGVGSAHLSPGSGRSRDDTFDIAVAIRRPKTVSAPTADPHTNHARAVMLPRAGGVATAPREEVQRSTLLALSDPVAAPVRWLGRVPARGPPL